MEFKIGDKVIYPNQGVGVVDEVCKKNIGGRQQEFYLLKLLSNNSTVLVPTCNAEHVGLRRLCTPQELEKLYGILEAKCEEPDPDWKSRYKENVEKMKTGSIFEVAEVLKNLYYLSFQKSLSFREKKMFDRARQLVIDEIATVREEGQERVETLLDELLLHAHEGEEASAV